MNAPAAILTVRWLIRDTFRQAMSSGIFWLMLGVSVMCIAVCLTATVVGDVPLRSEGETDIEALPKSVAPDPAKAAEHGITVIQGRLELAFGAIKVDIGRDRQHAVKSLQLQLAGWVADTAGLLLALMWTAGFLPTFLEPGAIAVLLAKPVPRWSLLAGKFIGVLVFVLFQALIFVGGTWLALGIRTSVWDPIYFLCVPLLLLHFGVFFSFSVLLAVATRSTVACVFGSILFWIFCWAMNYGRHSALLTPELASIRESSPLFNGMIEAGYWILPKPLDFHVIMLNVLQGENYMASAVNIDGLTKIGAWHPELSLLASVATAAVLLTMAAYEFVTTDY